MATRVTSARGLYNFFTEKARLISTWQTEANLLNSQASVQNKLVGATMSSMQRNKGNSNSSSSNSNNSAAPDAAEANLNREAHINTLQMKMFMEYNNPQFREACTRLLVPPFSKELSEIERANVREMYRTLFRLEKIPPDLMTRRVKKEDALRMKSTEQLWAETASGDELEMCFLSADESAPRADVDKTWSNLMLVDALEADLQYARAAGEAMAKSENQNSLLAAQSAGSDLAGGSTAFDGWLLHQEVGLKPRSVFSMIDGLKSWVPHAIRMKKMAMVAETKKCDLRDTPSVFTTPTNDVSALRNFCLDVAEKLGFDHSRGQIEILNNRTVAGVDDGDDGTKKTKPRLFLPTSVTGITLGLSPDDVRITIPLAGGGGVTAHSPASILRCLCHELGHALYEQNRPGAKRTLVMKSNSSTQQRQQQVNCDADMPASLPRSVAMNEAQAILFERIMARPAFFNFLAPVIQKHFSGHDDSGNSLFEQWKQHEPASSTDPLRNCLEMCMMCELERNVLNNSNNSSSSNNNNKQNQSKGNDVRVLPRMVKSKLDEYFQGDPSAFFSLDDARSLQIAEQRYCLNTSLRLTYYFAQGMFGYLPTYLVGAVYAAELHDAMCRDLTSSVSATQEESAGNPDRIINDCLNRGDISPITGWLAEKVWQRGSIPLDSHELILQATGSPTGIESYRKYLLRA